MESKFFKNLFVISVDDFFSVDGNERYFVFQGSKNWDIYLFDKPKNIEYCKIENVKLLSFKDESDFLQTMKNIDLIDYSLEHVSELNKYFLLVNNEI